MWYSILELYYSSLVMQLLHSSGEETSTVNLLHNVHSPVEGDNISVNLKSPCPEFNETSSVRMLYYAEPSNPALRGCYDDRSTTQCGENMRFVETELKGIGDCECDDVSKRLLIYHHKTNKCYPIFTQGYCSPGMWLDLTSDGQTPTCTQNPCYDSSTSEKDIVPLSLTPELNCQEVNSKCGPTHIIGFEDGKRLAQCIFGHPRFNMNIRAIGAPQHKCKPGSYRASNGKCQPAFVIFD